MIGLFTMGGQEVEQEVVLACVKDIIGEPRSTFSRLIDFVNQYCSVSVCWRVLFFTGTPLKVPSTKKLI